MELGPEASIEARILTDDDAGLSADDVRFGNNLPPFAGFAGPVAGLIQNDAGTWTPIVPEPSMIGILASAIAALALLRRRSIRQETNSL